MNQDSYLLVSYCLGQTLYKDRLYGILNGKKVGCPKSKTNPS